MTLRLRVPYWATSGVTAKLNDKPIKIAAAPSSYLVVDRAWRDRDRLELKLPFSFHVAAMPDDAAVQAFMYGPLVLAGRLSTDRNTDENRRPIPPPPRQGPQEQKPQAHQAPEPIASTAQ